MRLLLWISFALTLGLTFPRAGVAADAAKSLASLRTLGGLTPRGLGHAEFKIGEDGTFEWYNQQRDETLPFGGQPGVPTGFNGWSRSHITAEELAKLREAIAAIDFDQIKLDPTRISPSAGDGGDTTLELTSATGPHSIPLWQLTSPPSLPVVDLLRSLQSKYAREGGPAPVSVASPTPSPEH